MVLCAWILCFLACTAIASLQRPAGTDAGVNVNQEWDWPAIHEAARRSARTRNETLFTGQILDAPEIQALLKMWNEAPKSWRENRTHHWVFEDHPIGGPILRKLMEQATKDFPSKATSWRVHGGGDFIFASSEFGHNGLGLHADNSFPRSSHWIPNYVPQRTVSISTILQMPEEGGRLCFLGEDAITSECPERGVGHSTWFTSDERNQHYVEHTSKGARLSFVTWIADFGCAWSPCSQQRDGDGFTIPMETSWLTTSTPQIVRLRGSMTTGSTVDMFEML